jgi:hypothetical protein
MTYEVTESCINCTHTDAEHWAQIKDKRALLEMA